MNSGGNVLGGGVCGCAKRAYARRVTAVPRPMRAHYRWERCGKPVGRTAQRVVRPGCGRYDSAHHSQGDGDAVIELLLPRRTAVCRQSVHNVHERQVMAANVDLVAIATSLNRL